MAPDLSWRSQGKCRGMRSEIFYPNEFSQRGNKEAIFACQGCPVWEKCYDWALRNEDYGFWAGMTEQERRRKRVVAGISIRSWTIDSRILSGHGTHAGYQRHIRAGEQACISCLEAKRRYYEGQNRHISDLNEQIEQLYLFVPTEGETNEEAEPAQAQVFKTEGVR